MNNSNLLKEAIADAKAVKEIAFKNAMASINETFQPTIQRMITQKLSEEDMEGFEDEDEVPMDVATESDDEVCEEEVPTVDDEDDAELDAVIAELEGETEEVPVEDVPMDDVPADEFSAETDISDEELDEILREMEDDAPVEDMPADDMEEVTRLRKENKKLRADLKEAYKAIQTQKEAITEVTLLNTKLGYSQKIMKKYSLSESQKGKVLEAFDRASTLKETKLVYATLVETLANSTPKLNKKPIASKSITTVNEGKEILNENRWARLAGIK